MRVYGCTHDATCTHHTHHDTRRDVWSYRSMAVIHSQHMHTHLTSSTSCHACFHPIHAHALAYPVLHTHAYPSPVYTHTHTSTPSPCTCPALTSQPVHSRHAPSLMSMQNHAGSMLYGSLHDDAGWQPMYMCHVMCVSCAMCHGCQVSYGLHVTMHITSHHSASTSACAWARTCRSSCCRCANTSAGVYVGCVGYGV